MARHRTKNIHVEPWATALLARRTELGLSQEALAVKAGSSQAELSKLEGGLKHPLDLSSLRLAAYISALGWTPAKFFRETGIDPAITLDLDGDISGASQELGILLSNGVVAVPTAIVQGLSLKPLVYCKVHGELYVDDVARAALQNINHLIIDTTVKNSPVVVIKVAGKIAITQSLALNSFSVLTELGNPQRRLLVQSSTPYDILGTVIRRYTYLGSIQSD